MLLPVPVVCFVEAFFTDLIYWKTATIMWANISAWLLTAGLLVSIFVVLAGLISFLGDNRGRAARPTWIHVVGYILVLILSIFNAFIHSRDAYTSVVPTGLILSRIAVLILLAMGWNSWATTYRHGLGVRSEEVRL
jgi:uncharacterized membrane protein